MWKVGVPRMGSGSTEKRWIGDIYHCDRGDKGKPMGQVANKSVEKGVGSMKKKA
jgi:hypothetical protein